MDTITVDSAPEDMDVYEELKRCKKENNDLNRRLLGVNELARLLQEKTEFSNSLQEKNKRLEIAVVRLENRCSNLEKKMKTGQHSSLPSNTGEVTNPKSLPNSPFIPGPSRQILETLMKDNHELKKTINNLMKGGPAGYKEAVKLNHLEEVIEQKNEKIDLLHKQIEGLTAPHDDESNVMATPGLLQRQLLKMEQAMKVKDRFCTLLSDKVSQLERDLMTAKDDNSIDGDSEDSMKQLIKELELREKKCHKVIDELRSQVEQERNEKKDLIGRAEENTKKADGLQSELASLNLKVESLNTYNSALVREKMDLSSDVMRLNDKLQQRQDDAKLKRLEDETSRLQEQIKNLEDDNYALNNQLFHANSLVKELQSTKSLSGRSGGGYVNFRTGPGTNFPRALEPMTNRGQEVMADGRGGKIRHSPEPQHCGSNMITYTHRELLTARGIGTDSPPETTVPATPTTPTITPSSAANTRSLDMNMLQQQQMYNQRYTANYGQYQPNQPPPNPTQMDGGASPSLWQQQYPPRSHVMSLPVNQSQSDHYHVPVQPTHPPQPQYMGNAMFGGAAQFGTNASLGGMHPHAGTGNPGSGYMTHSTNEYSQPRYYTSNPQPSPVQRRPSPPSQQQNNSGPQQPPHYQ